MNALGIDLSAYETKSGVSPTPDKHVPFSWQGAYSAGIRVVTLRQMEGKNLDKQYQANRADWSQTVVPIQVIDYQRLDLVRGTIVAQGKAWLPYLTIPKTPVMIDLENVGTHTGWRGMIAELVPYLNLVEDYTDALSLLYMNPSFMASYFSPSDVLYLAGRGLVAAHYAVPFPQIYPPFTPLDLVGWQYTKKAFAEQYGVRNGNKEAALYVFDLNRIKV